MKKILFKDKFGLTDAVLEGRKTMTRRIMPAGLVDMYLDGLEYNAILEAPYKLGEVVAVAQPYSSFRPLISHNDDYSPSHPGWNNKMFVRSDLMPHQIRITDIKIERLQDISDEDCCREGLCVSSNSYAFPYYGRHGFGYRGFSNPKRAFAELIDLVSGRGTWESNPWVFVYSFELVK